MNHLHRRRPSPQRARCTLVWLGATSGAVGLLTWLLPHALRQRPEAVGSQRFDLVLLMICEAAVTLGVGWLWFLVTLATLDAARGDERRRTGVPTLVRRGVLAACGLGLAGGIAAPAGAAAGGGDDGASGTPADASSVVGLPVPDRTTAAAGRARPPTPAAADRSTVRTVVVAPGDTLWDLALADLPPAADIALVDSHWRAIHTANRSVIGPDPDLIRPGQRLHLPAPPDPETRT